MAAASALAHRHIVSLVLGHLSDMKYHDRRQNGPDQPVEFLEFRPTLVPSICVNKLWAEAGTSILWRRYPHLPSLKDMPIERRRWYAAKVERLFVSSSTSDSVDALAYLEPLDWPSLKSLELEADSKWHGSGLQRIMHPNLEHIEICAAERGDSTHNTARLLSSVFACCQNLRSIHIGPDTIDPNHPVQGQALSELLETNPSIKDVSIMNAGFSGKDLLFHRLSRRSSLEALEIDLDPGLQLLPFLQDLTSSSYSFISLRRFHVMCYPEIALALPAHLLNVEQLSIDVARIPDQPSNDSDVAILDNLLSVVQQCQRLQLFKVNIGLLATNFPSTEFLPVLHGASLINLATACTHLKDLTLLVSEPAGIDASGISSAQFEHFCQMVPRLTQLSLKLHPRTTMALEESALQSLGRHCQQLEVLRLKVALHLPSLTTANDPSILPHHDHVSSATSTQTKLVPRENDASHLEIETAATQASSLIVPLFRNLVQFSLARPQTVLSVAASTYATSSNSQSSSVTDPWLEEELVRSWAQSLLLHFPRLDILEAWSDWTGHENDSLNYFLPLEEPLASIWEFLSGIEQDLWDDGQSEAIDEPERWDADFDEGVSFRGSGDWDRASLINEYPEIANSGYLETYEEEPEDMVTPIDGKQAWFTDPDSKLTTVSNTPNNMATFEVPDIHDLDKQMRHITLHPLAEGQQ